MWGLSVYPVTQIGCTFLISFLDRHVTKIVSHGMEMDRD